MYSIGQFAKMTGVTIRTLRFYHEKELLIPAYISETNRRYYTDDDILILQNITTLQYLGHSLEEIKKIQQNIGGDMYSLLLQQKEQLEQKKEKINKAISSINIAMKLTDSHEIIDNELLLSIINELSRDVEQKQYLAAHLPKSLIDKIYNQSDEKITIYYKDYYKIVSQIKELYRRNDSDTELKKVLYKFKNFVPSEIRLEMEEHLKRNQIDEAEYQKHFKSPFTEDEEKWLREKFEQLKNES